MLAGEVFIREQRNYPGPRRQRRMHLLHEVAVGEVPLLEHNLVPGVLDNVADLFRERRVGTRAADEEIRKLLCGRVWRPVKAAFPETSAD